ncbi:MAG: surface glycan-binding family protein [Breznakibacter sp.]
MKKIFLFLIGLTLALLTSHCTEDSFGGESVVDASPTTLSYAEVLQVREGKAFKSGIPAVGSGGRKVKFEISGGTLSQAELTSEMLASFSIVDTTGVISAPANNNLTEGEYKLKIKVTNTIGATVFNEGFKMVVLPALAEGLAYPTNKITFERGKDNVSEAPDFVGNKADVVFSLVETAGSSYFSIDGATGKISMSASSLPEIGNYKLTVSVNNKANVAQTFKDVITVDVVSKPYSLVFDPAVKEVAEYALGFSSTPSVKASNPSTIEYALGTSSSPYFSIDAKTGVITLAAMHPFKVGELVPVAVRVTNNLGSTLVEDAFTFKIVAQEPVAPYDFSYLSNSATVGQGKAFSSDMPNVKGAFPIRFSFASGNGSGQFSINEATGQIGLSAGNTLPAGDYLLKVKASNAFGEAVVDFNVTITAPQMRVLFDADFKTLGKTGNMRAVDLEGNLDATGRKKGWIGNGNMWLKDNTKQNGVQMFCDKVENSDWLLAENINLSGLSSVELFLEFYLLFADNNSDVNKLFIKVSEDFTGNVESATWTVLNNGEISQSFDDAHLLLSSATKIVASNPAADQVLASDYVEQLKLNLDQYAGKTITIAIHAHHSLQYNPAKALTALSRGTCVTNFIVKGE